MKWSTRTRKTRKADPIGTRLGAVIWLTVLLGAREATAEEFAPPALSIPPRVETSYSISKDRPRVNEIVDFSLKIRWRGASEDIRFITPDLPLENLELISHEQSAETYSDGDSQVRERVLTFHLRPLKRGPARIRSFHFLMGLPGSTAFDPTQIAGQELEIQPDWGPVLRLASWSAGAIVVLTAGIAVAVRFRRRRLPLAPLPSAEDQMIQELSIGMAEIKSSAAQVRKVAGVFKNFLKHRYGLTESGMGGLDFKEAIHRRRDIPADERETIVSIFNQLTESQFAGTAPSVEQAGLLSKNVLSFIESSKIVG